jgi:anti-anti-sigma factor
MEILGHLDGFRDFLYTWSLITQEVRMEIKVSHENGRVPVTVMHVKGNIDSASYGAFQAKAEELMQAGTRALLIDLTEVPFVSSAGLRALNDIFTALRHLAPDVSDKAMRDGINAGTYKSPHLKLLNPSPASMVALENSGFSMFLESFTDLNTAIASFH